MSTSPITKRQHYVWRHYLDAWATHGSFCCYRQKNNKIFPTQPKEIASETYFYESVPLTDADKQVLEALINRASDARLRELNQGWVEFFTMSFDLRRNIDMTRLNEEQKIDVERGLRNAEKTIGELWHTSIENRSQKILDSIRNQSDEFYHDAETCGVFLHFICNQYFRTAKMRQAITGIARPIEGHDPRRTNLIESHIYATNVSSSLFRERESYVISFLVNNTDVPFVTGDQPIINLLDPTKTNDINFYYPLSPTLAMLFRKNGQESPSKKRDVTALEVETYNYEIYRKSEDQVYSDNDKYLRELISIGKNVLPE